MKPRRCFYHVFFTLLFSIFFALSYADIEHVAVAGGSITEIIYRLGEQHKIVGVDSTSQYPVAAKDHPLLGYARNVSTEGVLSLSPDLFIGETDTGPFKIVNQIKATGVNTVITKSYPVKPATT
jgi:iron complex transport system substrate-binding protein